MNSNQIEIIPVGGHSDFGRNMTAVRVGDEIVIFDMGVKLDPLQGLPEGQGVDNLPLSVLRELEAVPDDRVLERVDAKVVAIVISHAHADHVSAVQALAHRYPKVPIVSSPYTKRFIEETCRVRGDSKNRLSIPNKLVTLEGRQTLRLGKGTLEVELVHVTHSIPGTTMPVLHTPKGAIVYALDFKLDNTPVIGKRPDYARLSQIGRDGVHVLITEATNVAREEKTDSERIARMRLRDLMLGIDHDQEALFVTTFSSQAARMTSILDFADRLERDVLIVGRSLERYQKVAADTGHLDIPSWVEFAPTRRHADDALRRVDHDPTRFLVVLTGHQGEPGAALTRIASGEASYKMGKRDDVIFSSHVIPTETCIAQRADLERQLKRQGTRVFNGAHVSGHGSAVDHRELLQMLQPEHIVPAHGGIAIQNAYAELADAEGWRPQKEVHVLANGQRYLIGKKPSPVPTHTEDRAVRVSAQGRRRSKRSG